MTDTKNNEKIEADSGKTAGEEPFYPMPLENKKDESNRRFGRTIAYGIQQTFACWATDFLDPPISAWYQKRFGKPGHGGDLEDTVKGEIVGDSAAFFAYVGLKRFFGGPIDAVISMVKKAADPLLEKAGKSAVHPWAESHGVSEDDPRYKKRIEEYKQFQAENVVDSSIISVSATGLNVLAQKHMFGNQQSYRTILESKILGASLTLGVMFLARALFPTSTRTLDKEIEDRYVAPGAAFAKRAFGVKDETPSPTITKTPEGHNPDNVTVSKEKRNGLLAMVAEHAEKIDFDNADARAALIARQKSVYQAFNAALADNGPLAAELIHEHYETLERDRKINFGTSVETVLQDKELSRRSVLESLAHKRRDMEQFITLLDDASFLDDVKHAVKNKSIPERKNSTITAEQKHYMSESLLKQSAATGVYEEAEAQALNYKAIAHGLMPNSKAERILASELKKRLPDYDPKDVDGIAADYIQYYQKEALLVADQLKPDAEPVKEAVARAAAIRNKYHAPSEASYSMAT